MPGELALLLEASARVGSVSGAGAGSWAGSHPSSSTSSSSSAESERTCAESRHDSAPMISGPAEGTHAGGAKGDSSEGRDGALCGPEASCHGVPPERNIDNAGSELVATSERHRFAITAMLQPGALKLDIFAQYAASKWPTQGASAGTGASRDGCGDVDPGLEAAICWAFREPDARSVPRGDFSSRIDEPDGHPMEVLGGTVKVRGHRDPMVCDFSPRMR